MEQKWNTYYFVGLGNSQQKIPKANKGRTRTFSEFFFQDVNINKNSTPRNEASSKTIPWSVTSLPPLLELENMKSMVTEQIQVT